MLVQDIEPEQRLPEEGVDPVDLQAVSALELLLQRRLAKLRLDVQPFVFDPRLANQEGSSRGSEVNRTRMTRRS